MQGVPKALKIIIIIANILIICVFAGFGTVYLFNILANYKSATTNDYISFFGGIVGAAISALIAIVALVITISSGNKNQKQALNIQSSLQVENNMTLKMEKARLAITEAYNQLEVLLLMVTHLKLSNNDYSSERKGIIEIYATFRKAINTIRFNTEIYYDLSRCEGCTDCYVKSYGEFVKRAMELQKHFMKIDKECSYATNELKEAIDIAMDSYNLISQQGNIINGKSKTEGLIRLTQNQLANANETDKSTIEENISNLEKERQECDAKIDSLQKTLISNSEKIGAKNQKARELAQKISVENKVELDNSIYKYFESYKLYITESITYTSKNGRLFINVCKKYNFNDTIG